MKTYKILCLALSLIFAVSSLSACDLSQKSAQDTTDTAALTDGVSDVENEQNSSSGENNSPENVSSAQTNSGDASSENSSETTSSTTSKPQQTDLENDEDEYVAKAPERDPSKSETEQWYLMLANPDNPVSKEYISNVDKAKIDLNYTDNKSSSRYLDSRVVDAFVAMCKAAQKDGIKMKTISAYRTYEYQESLFKKRIKRLMDENGLSEEKATEKAATMVARPGTSEHNLGLAVDINSVETSFENSKAFEWLQENAEDFGFVLRYPKDKKAITKIIYEPWHYRYVGVEHAKEMNRLDMCLEEYIDYLNAQNN